MAGRKSVFLSAMVGVLVGCMLTVMAMPYFLEKANLDIRTKGSQENETSNVQANQVTYVETTDNVYKSVAKKAMPSVVGIQTTAIVQDRFWGFTYPATGVGTGIIVTDNGYVLTNYHVVQGATKDGVTVLLSDGTKEIGEIVWTEDKRDLAILKINRTNLQAAELGDSDALEVGDLAIAIGNPLGLDFERTMTEGIISGLNRSLQVDDHIMDHLIQTSAAINRGNSGGPLLNAKGQVVGINTLKEGNGEALGFAIPINSVKPLIQQGVKNGKLEKVTLGISGTSIDEFRQKTGEDYGVTEGGVIIYKVQDKTPAKKAGLKPVDVILEIDGRKVDDMQMLAMELYSYKKGDKAVLTVIREGEKLKVEVQF